MESESKKHSQTLTEKTDESCHNCSNQIEYMKISEFEKVLLYLISFLTIVVMGFRIYDPL